jgi:hypothetical protein
LWRHKRGEDVAEVMAAFDDVRLAEGQEREEAVRRVRAVLARH